MKNDEFTTQDYFSSYIKAAVKNTKMKYIKKQMQFQELEISLERCINSNEKEESYDQYQEPFKGYLGNDLYGLCQLFDVIDNERLIKALKKLDRQRL